MELAEAGTDNILAKKITFAAQVISTITCAWFIAGLFELLVDRWLPEPLPSRLATRSQFKSNNTQFSNNIIAERNLFQLDVSNGSQINLDADPVRTGMNIALIGTVIFQNPDRSLAAIQDNNDSKVYPSRKGDEIIGKMQILSVEATKVIFINLQNNIKEYIDLPEDQMPKISRAAPASSSQSSGVVKSSPTKFTVSRDELDQQLANFDTLIREAKAEPEFQGGAFRGFRLKEIKQGSFYEKIGLQLNDLIIGVNGEKITDVARALALLNDLKTMDSLKLGINRNGKDTVLSYDIQ